MLLSVREIINTPGKKISFQFSMDLSCVEFGGYCPVAEPVVVTGTVRNMAGVLVMQAPPKQYFMRLRPLRQTAGL